MAQKPWFLAGAAALLVTNALSYLVPALLGQAIDRLALHLPVWWLCVAVFATALVQALSRIASRLWIFNAARDVEQSLREKIFTHVLQLPPREVLRFSTGDLQSRLTNDLMNVRLLFGAGLLNFVNTTLAYGCAVPMLIWYGGWLAAIALLPYPFLMLVMQLLARKIFVSSAESQKRLGQLTNFVSESVGARLFVIAASWFEVERRRFDRHNEGFYSASVRAATLRSYFAPLGMLTGALSAVFVLMFGGGRVMNNEMSLGELVAFNAYLAMLAFPTLMLGFMIALSQRGLASYARIAEVLSVETSKYGSSTLSRAGIALDGRTQRRSLGLSAQGVKVWRGERLILDEVSLGIEQGGRLGIVGEVGSGKSTLLSVLAWMDVPRTGAVRYASAPGEEVDAGSLSLDALRSNIALVPQQTFLFSASIVDNVTQGRDVALEQVEEALRLACVLDEMKQLKDGLHTVVGERGVTLSGGQRQRVALARALCSQPGLLLIDDGLSAVDSDTEHRIIENLLTLPFAPTLIIASHRLAVIERMQQVLVLSGGRIVEHGNHSSLLASSGVYAKLYRKQRLHERLQERLHEQSGEAIAPMATEASR